MEKLNDYKCMLCETATEADLDDPNKAAEWKYDGTRILAGKFEGEPFIINRKGVVYTDRLVEVIEALKGIAVEDVIFDGEAVYYDANGRSLFEGSQRRCRTEDPAKQKLLRHKYPIVMESFDLLRLDGKDIRNMVWQTRKKLLEDLLKESLQTSIKMAPHAYDEEKQVFWEQAVARGEEGLILKHIHSPYVGKRSRFWLKLKKWYHERCLVIGYTEGTGERDGLFGALILAQPDDEGYLSYCGKVGSGFKKPEVRKIAKLLKESEVETKTVDAKNSDGKSVRYTPVELPLEITVRYQEMTKNNVFRMPTILKDERGNNLIHFEQTIEATPKQSSLLDLWR